MATKKQTQTAKRNIRRAQGAARSKRTIANMPKSTRRALGQQAARGRWAGAALEDRNRTQLYERAKKLNIPGRSTMGKWELIEAIRRAS